MRLVLTSDCAALAVHAARKLLLSASVGRGGAAAEGVARAAGACFTCFISTKVQVRTPEKPRRRASPELHLVLALLALLVQKYNYSYAARAYKSTNTDTYSSTKVQIVTAEEVQASTRSLARSLRLKFERKILPLLARAQLFAEGGLTYDSYLKAMIAVRSRVFGVFW